MGLALSVDRLAEYSQARHDFVPVQVGSLQVSHLVWVAQIALPPMEQAPVVKGDQVACRRRWRDMPTQYSPMIYRYFKMKVQTNRLPLKCLFSMPYKR